MKFDDACFITEYIKSACIYHGYQVLQDGEVISPENIIVDDTGITIVHNNTTHVLFVNDENCDEGLYCTTEDWFRRCFVETRSFVKKLDVNDIIKKALYSQRAFCF